MNVLLRVLTIAIMLAFSPYADDTFNTTLLAQPIVVNMPPGTLPKTVPTTASVTIGGTFAIVPAAPALVQSTQQGNPCNPGACFTGQLTVNANQAWKVQVRVRPTAPNTFYANWITAANTPVALSSNWFTIQSGATSSTGVPAPLKFNANKVTGKNGVMPTAAQLSGYLEFRIVAL